MTVDRLFLEFLYLFRIYPLFTFSLELNSFFYIPPILYMQKVYLAFRIILNKTYLNHRNLLLLDLFSMDLWTGFNYNPKNNSLAPLFFKKNGYPLAFDFRSPTLNV